LLEGFNNEPRRSGVVVLHNRTMSSARRMLEFDCDLNLVRSHDEAELIADQLHSRDR
jgi:hypothetical protein